MHHRHHKHGFPKIQPPLNQKTRRSWQHPVLHLGNSKWPRSIPAGFSLIELVVVMAVISVLLSISLPAILHVREAGRQVQCQNNFRQVSLAMHHFLDVGQRFPDNFALPWPLEISPFSEGSNFKDPFCADSNPNSPERQKRLHAEMPLLRCPSGRSIDFNGYPGSNIGLNPDLLACGLQEITDGTSNTLMLGELPSDLGFPWAAGPLAFPAGLGSAHPQKKNVALADGSIRWIPDTIDGSVLTALFTINKGETISLP